MKSNEPRKNQSLIVFGVLLVVFISISAVIAYVYFKPSSISISQGEVKKEIALQESETIENRSAVAVNERVSSADLIQDSKSVKLTKKEAPSREDKINDRIYASVSFSDRENASSRSERVVTGLRNPMSWPSRNEPPPVPTIKKGVSGVSRSTYDQIGPDSPLWDVIPDNSPDSREGVSVNDDPEDKPALTDEGNNNPDDTVGQSDKYNVSVSRSINAGEVILAVAVKNNPPDGLIINEFIPAGWLMTSASPAPLNCMSFPCSGSLKWLFITKNVGNDITYSIEKIDDSAGSSISGKYFFNDSAAGRMTVTTKGASGV